MLALSPDGRFVVGSSKPGDVSPGSPDLQLVRISDGRIVSRLPGSQIARALGRGRAALSVPGAWRGDRIVAAGADALVVLRARPPLLGVERVVRLNVTPRPAAYRGPFVYAPTFVRGTPGVVARAPT